LERGEVAIIDRPPEWVRLMGLAAFDHREPSVQVADLDYDSLMTGTDVTGAERVLRFSADDRTVTVRVTATGKTTVSLAISIAPARAVRADIRPVHGPVQRRWVSPDGHVTCDDVPSGPLSILVHWAAPLRPVRTAWVQV
jgi:hypothetical protein